MLKNYTQINYKTSLINFTLKRSLVNVYFNLKVKQWRPASLISFGIILYSQEHIKFDNLEFDHYC